MIVGPDLQLGIKIEIQEHKARKSSRGVTRWERFQRVIDLVFITSADSTVVHDLSQPIAGLLRRDRGNVWLANSEEVRAQASDKPFEEDLEDGSGDDGV